MYYVGLYLRGEIILLKHRVSDGLVVQRFRSHKDQLDIVAWLNTDWYPFASPELNRVAFPVVSPEGPEAFKNANIL